MILAHLSRFSYSRLMHGPQILTRTLSASARTDRYGNRWQYMSRSDHHSKVACWSIVFDLMLVCPLLRRHVAAGSVCFGINHEMRDFKQDRKKDLDLVLCTPANSGGDRINRFDTLVSLAEKYDIQTDEVEHRELRKLPELRSAPVGSVLMALEAKACMTAHQRALPRLYDELNSSHLTVHGATEQAISAGFVMINAASRYLTPDLTKRNRRSDPEWSVHKQPRDASLAADKVKQIPRRSRSEESGYDALAIVIVDMANDGSPVRLVDTHPAPQPQDIYHYDQMIHRLSNLYATRFQNI